MIKALFKIIFGAVLCVSGLALECMWLAFCFGTVIVGIALLLWLPMILLLPFTFLSISGWRLLRQGLSEINSPNLGKISTLIAPIISAQISQIEKAGNRVPLDERVLRYFAALAFATGNRNLSLYDVIAITAGFYTAPHYRLAVANLKHCVDYKDGLRGFWRGVADIAPIAFSELAAGQGTTLIRMSEERIGS